MLSSVLAIIRRVRLQYPNVGMTSLLLLFLRRRFLVLLMNRGVVDATGMMMVKRRQWSGNESATCVNPMIICLSGFGHSGSGAVLDLFSEYDHVDVVGHVDCDGSLRRQMTPDIEFSLLRGPGGLFQMEKVLATGSYGVHDHQVHMFLSMVAYYYYECGELFGDKFIAYVREFLDRVLLFKIPCGNGVAFSGLSPVIGNRGSLAVWGDNRNFCYGLKSLDVHEFRRIAKEFVSKVVASMTSCQFIVLDQIVSDATGDVKKYEEYLGDQIRVIAVHRDPRDVYATAIKLNVTWIPRDVDAFVRWYRISNEKYFKTVHQNLLSLRFEDMVNDYDGVVSRINNFIGLDPQFHLHVKKVFDPLVSGKNVGLYKEVLDDGLAAQLYSELSEYCWAGGHGDQG